MAFTVLIKSGTCGYFDYDGIDYLVGEVPSDNIPSIGEYLTLQDARKDTKFSYTKYLVTEIHREYFIDKSGEFTEDIRVCVMKVGEVEW